MDRVVNTVYGKREIANAIIKSKKVVQISGKEVNQSQNRNLKISKATHNENGGDVEKKANLG